MNDQKLNQILNILESLQSGQKELHEITRAICDRQDETDAKLESLSMTMNGMQENMNRMQENMNRMQENMNRMQENMNRMEENMVRIERKLDDNLTDLRGDIRFLNHRIADIEIDVERLKTR